MYEAYPITLHRPPERFDYFHALVGRLFCPMDIESRLPAGQEFCGRVETAQLGEVRLAKVATSPCLVRRRREDVARISQAAYLVKFQTRGEALWRQRDREVHLRPGDFVLCSVSEPYWLEFRGPYEMPVLALTTTAMRRLTPDPDQFLGVRLPGEEADCGLLSSFVAQAAARMSALSGPMIRRVEANILDLLGGVLAARTRASRPSAAQQLAQVKAFIGARLHDRRLGPTLLAAAFGMSTRHLHSLFESEPMTLSRFIRARRVQAARAALEDCTAAPRSLTEFALDFGFYDLSHMTRSFRCEFGLTPSEVRALARGVRPD
ncbi:MAG TPA: helix-turn-helix domain-containing protein [Steroidobacteraceae bacterium]|nr:helix-turn-helix domain-containing protein [Steroidobacteraceae bacterium]